MYLKYAYLLDYLEICLKGLLWDYLDFFFFL